MSAVLPFPLTAAPSETDHVLVHRARAGERRAMVELLRRHEKKVRRLALGIVRDAALAADVVQDAFVRVLESIERFHGAASFGTWLYRVAYNCAVDALRRERRPGHVAWEESLEETAAELPRPRSDGRPDELFARGELSAALQRALATLGERHRTILLLREVEGLSYEEIAAVLDIPEGTVMSRLFHARRKMQAALAEFAPGVPERRRAGS